MAPTRASSRISADKATGTSRITRSTPFKVKASEFTSRQKQVVKNRNGALSKELAALEQDSSYSTPKPSATEDNATPAKARYGLRLRDSSHKVLAPTRVTKPSLAGRSRKKEYDGPGYQGNARKKSTARGIECMICAEIQDRRQFPDSEQMTKCDHESKICRTCIARRAESQLQVDGKWTRVQCMHCDRKISQDHLCKLVWREDYERLVQHASRRAAETHKRYRACVSPTCQSGQVHWSYNSAIVTCRDCGTQSCFNHRTSWHSGYTCDAYDDSHPAAKSTRTSEERLKSMAKKCPGKDCGFYIEKDGGCNSMYCSRCGLSFDWGTVKFEVTIKGTYKTVK